jgi:hypothetical protein
VLRCLSLSVRPDKIVTLIGANRPTRRMTLRTILGKLRSAARSWPVRLCIVLCDAAALPVWDPITGRRRRPYPRGAVGSDPSVRRSEARRWARITATCKATPGVERNSSRNSLPESLSAVTSVLALIVALRAP